MLRNSLLAAVAVAMLGVGAPNIATAGSPQVQAGVQLVGDYRDRRYDNRRHHRRHGWRGHRHDGPYVYAYPRYRYYPRYAYVPPPPPPPPRLVYPGGIFFGFSF